MSVMEFLKQNPDWLSSGGYIRIRLPDGQTPLLVAEHLGDATEEFWGKLDDAEFIRIEKF